MPPEASTETWPDTWTTLPTMTNGTYEATGAGGVGNVSPSSCKRASMRAMVVISPDVLSLY